jgi:drug/metabolite transporter (DMT)-like permease
VLIHPDAKVGDVLFYLPHEMVHLAGGREIEARTMDVQMIALLKGLAEKLRKSVKKSEFKASEYLEAKADLIELDALDWELDLHTARLERFREGQSFLKRNSLGRLEEVPSGILDEMAGATDHVIDSIPFRLGSGSDDLAGVVQVLDDKTKSASERRNVFDTRLLKVIIRKFLECSIRGYILKKYGQTSEPHETVPVDQSIQKKNRFNISRGFIYVFISAILGASMPMIGHHLMQSYSVYSVLLVRDLIVGVLLIPFVISKKVQNPTWKQFALISLLGFIMTGIGDPLYYEGIKRSSAVSAFLIYSSATLFLMTLASRFIFKEHLSLKKWLGAILTFSSALLIALGEASSSAASTLVGSLMVFGSAMAAAVWTILAKNLLKNLNPIFLIAIAFWTGVPILLIMSGANVSVAASPLIWVFGGITALVYILYYRGLKWVSALTVSILDLTSPMFTSLFSAIQRMQVPGVSELGALVLSTIGVLTYISATSKSKPHKKKQSENKLDEWLLFGKEVAKNLESYMTADDGMTIPQVVDVSDLDEDHGPSDILEALSYFVHRSNVPNSDVYDIIFRRLGKDRGMKLLLDARQDIREYLDLEENISDELFDEQMRVAKSIENELKKRFFSQALYKEVPLEKDKARGDLLESILARAA